MAGDGLIAAGFIEKKTTAPTPPFAVKGVVKNHDTTAQTFQVGTLTVQYAGATIGRHAGRHVERPAGRCQGHGLLRRGSGVRHADGEQGRTGRANVSSASRRPRSKASSSAVTANGFTIGNQVVATTGSTRYEGGVFGDIAVGTKLEAEGSISGGVLTATKVSFRDAIRLEGDIATFNAGTGNLTLTGLPGITVNVTSITELKNVGSIGALAVGNHLRIRGKLGSNGSVGASQLEVRSAATTASNCRRRPRR